MKTLKDLEYFLIDGEIDYTLTDSDVPFPPTVYVSRASDLLRILRAPAGTRFAVKEKSGRIHVFDCPVEYVYIPQPDEETPKEEEKKEAAIVV